MQQLKKEIPGTPEGNEQIHEKKSPIFTRIQCVFISVSSLGNAG